MRAESAVLPGEDADELRRRHEAWADELGAGTEAERRLVRAAVDASWRIDRCRAAEAAALTRKVLKAGDEYDDALADEVERAVDRLADDPAGVVRRLRRTSAGCRWLLGRWGELAERLDGWKALEPTERRLAAHLMGKRHDDLFDPSVARLTVAYLGALRLDADRACQVLRDDRPEGMGEVEFERRVGALCDALPDPAGGNAAQVAIVAGAIDELCERLELVEAREDRDRELAAREASFDATPAGASRLRYEMSHERTLRASLRDLRVLQQARAGSGHAVSPGGDGLDDPPHPGSAAVAPSEPKAGTRAPSEPKAGTRAPSEAKQTCDDAPTEAIAEGDDAPTEAKPEAGTAPLAPTEAKAGAGTAPAPTEPKGVPARPAAAIVGEEGGTTGIAAADQAWMRSATGGLGELMVGAT